MRSLRSSVVALVGSIALTGCATHQLALKGDAIGAVQADLKRQIGVYVRAATRGPYWVDERGTVRYIGHDGSEFWCGNGDVDYVVSSIEVDLTTTRDTTAGGNLGFTVPVQMVTIGGKAAISKEVADVEILKYHLWPYRESAEQLVAYYGLPSSADVDRSPIASAMLTLRNQQVYAAMKMNPSVGEPTAGPQPCFTDYDPVKTVDGEKQTFSIGITTTYDASGQLSVGLGPVTLGASGETKSITGQMLLVSFEQRGLADIKKASAIAATEKPIGRSTPPHRAPPSADHPQRGVMFTPYHLDTLSEVELRRAMQPQVSPPPAR